MVFNQRNFVLEERHKEQPKGQSLTIPGQSLNLSEYLLRFSRGQGVPYMTNYTYDDEVFEEGLPDLAKMDRIDLDEYEMDLKEQIVMLEERRKEVKEKEKEAKKTAAEVKQAKVKAFNERKKQQDEENAIVEDVS